jgi:Phage stabilisation protein
MPDNLVSLIVDHREVWLFGTQSVEVWYDAGLEGFPLARIQGAVNELGCAATFSVAKLDNSLFWLGSDARGQGIVYRANGYSGQRISTHAVEYAIQSYDVISDAVAFTYQQDGHSFYVLTFPTAEKTWVYDVATQAWHERAGFANGKFIRHRANCQMFFNNTNVVGDYQNNKIYAYDLDVYADDNQPQKWLRSWRALNTNQNNLKRTAQHSLQVDCQTGVGLNDGQGSDPKIMLRWSDDGGHSWSNEHWASVGKIGVYGYRAFWRRLGMTTKLRDRVYELSGTDPVKITLLGAELNLSGTNA